MVLPSGDHTGSPAFNSNEPVNSRVLPPVALTTNKFVWFTPRPESPWLLRYAIHFPSGDHLAVWVGSVVSTSFLSRPLATSSNRAVCNPPSSRSGVGFVVKRICAPSGDQCESLTVKSRSEERRVGKECRSRWWP